MNRYLLDTNHLSAYLDRHASIEQKVDERLRAGDRVGLCLPVLCEYRAGIRLGRHYQRNLSRLNAALGILRLWPVDEETAAEFAELFRELRAAGRVMSQFDLLIAALARQRKLILLTADQDFRPVTGIHVENWL
jgi:predicted nucleic acid-binding protein